MRVAGGQVVRLPFGFGQEVFHKSRRERSPGMVTGFSVRPGCVYVLVTWSEDLRESAHCVFELTSEFVPSYCEESD